MARQMLDLEAEASGSSDDDEMVRTQSDDDFIDDSMVQDDSHFPCNVFDDSDDSFLEEPAI